jgi:hypothetical protein
MTRHLLSHTEAPNHQTVTRPYPPHARDSPASAERRMSLSPQLPEGKGCDHPVTQLAREVSRPHALPSAIDRR